MLNRFGRGSSIGIEPGPVTLKGLYIQDTSAVPQSSFGGEISYAPISPLSLSLSLLQTSFTKKSETILQTSSSALSHSLMGLFQHENFGEHTAEYARTGAVFGSSKNDTSYYLYSRASLLKNTWYALQAIYAKPNFVGYYQDTSQLYASVGFPIIRKMQGTVSYNKIFYNIKNLPQNGAAPRSHNIYGGISYSFPFGLYTSFYYNFLRSKNAGTEQGYQTQYVTLNGGQTFKHFTLQGIIEYGRYQDLLNLLPERSWQNYQIYTYYQPTPRQQYSLYTRIGYIQLSEEIAWARIYGTSCAWSATPSLKWQLLYEYTDQLNFRNYFSTRVQYTLANRHSFELYGYLNKQTEQKDVLEFLLSYSIPWGLPIRKKKSQGNIYGKILKQESDIHEAPYPNLVVHCNGMRTLTDKKGNFTFPGLTPGDYHLWVDEKTQNWVSSKPLPQTVHVQKGDLKETNIRFEHPASLHGKLPLFNFSHDILEETGYLENASLVLESTSTKERIFTTTNAQGVFSFDHLAPGRWILNVISSSIPSYHYLETKELLIDLFPGEEKTITLKVLPVKRELRIIDTDTIHSSSR